MEEPESGANVELGHPVIVEEREKKLVEATLPVVEDALHEFYKMRGGRDKQAGLALQAMRNPEIVFKIASDDLERKEPDTTVAIAILESVRGELQLQRQYIEGADEGVGPEAQAEREGFIEKDLQYQEAEERLFSADESYGELPVRDDLMEWFSVMKEDIKKMAKAEDEKYRDAEQGEGIGRIWRSRLLTVVPAIERFLANKEIVRDYDEVSELIDANLRSLREEAGNWVMQYANDPKAFFRKKMREKLVDIKETESFLAMLEGERNERIAKRQP